MQFYICRVILIFCPK